MSMRGVRVSILCVIAALFAAGCFDPPITQPPPDELQQVVIPLPYDLAWDAVNAVVKENSFHVQAQDMTNGIIEAVGPRFTLHDADCGKVKSLAGAYSAEPQANSSSVYNFLVRPRGREATLVEVRATFNSSVTVPLHPTTDVDCVSHGIQESNLLRDVLAEAKKTHRPEFASPSGSPRRHRRRRAHKRRGRLPRRIKPGHRRRSTKRRCNRARRRRRMDFRWAGISSCQRRRRSRPALARA